MTPSLRPSIPPPTPVRHPPALDEGLMPAVWLRRGGRTIHPHQLAHAGQRDVLELALGLEARILVAIVALGLVKRATGCVGRRVPTPLAAQTRQRRARAGFVEQPNRVGSFGAGRARHVHQKQRRTEPLGRVAQRGQREPLRPQRTGRHEDKAAHLANAAELLGPVRLLGRARRNECQRRVARRRRATELRDGQVAGEAPFARGSEQPIPGIGCGDITRGERGRLRAALPGGHTVPAGVASILNGYFCIPDNEQLIQYWSLVANRLYKIRHGLNLQGQATQPALFGPPLNPATLVDGGAYGATGPAGSNNMQVPYYRFDQMIQLAKNFTQQVVGLGNELLAALEKQDGETLSQLRQTQESAIFNMTLQAKADMVNQLYQTQVGLQYSLESSQTELDTIQGWATQQLLPEESTSLSLGNDAMIINSVAAGVVGTASLAYLFMNIFGLSDGGFNFGGSMEAISKALGASAQAISESAGLMREKASYIRREQEWNLRIQTITDAIGQINAQLAANQYAISAAQQDYSITQTQYQQSQDVLNFLQTKFTNEDLYVWMAGQLSTLYYQAYQMALELAQQAQTCYQYELSSSDTFLTGNPWNDQYKGLLAGDALSLSLAQMEKAYHDNNSRYQEIHKTFSLMQQNPQALLDLKKKGSCKFSFTELDFDLDFPGHYNRKIASISLTIPAVVGPYQNLNATLIQTSNQVLVRPDINGVKSLLTMGGVPPNGAIRANWSANQQISISTGINDAGLFQLNFNDPQYLPFEGTGAISDWELIMPKAANAFDFAAITDVIIQISYTASPGGQTFARQVTNLDQLKNYQGSLYLSLRQQYSSAWYAFLSTYGLNFNLLRGQFPVNLATDSLSLGKNGNAYLALVLANPDAYTDLPSVTLNGSDWDPGTGAAAIGEKDNFKSGNELGWQVALDFSSGGSGLLDGDSIDPKVLLDIILIVPFSGQLDWGN
ncbi:MAG: hypothetical protein HUU01_17975 [Saprospiraceae bacterium]|nr:hypothetical protein [Saprospiraceae bacterium]